MRTRSLCRRAVSTAAAALSASLLLLGHGPPASAQVRPAAITSLFGPNVAPGETPQVQPRQAGRPRTTPAQRLRYWNEIAIDAGAFDHTPMPGDQTLPDQQGPARTSRALAIVHIALFEAVNAIGRTYRSYTGLPPAPPETSIDVAIAQAGADTLVKLYPKQAETFRRLLKEELADIVVSPVARTNGIRLGQDAADSILRLRQNDGSHHPEPSIFDLDLPNRPGIWSIDPHNPTTLALGGFWSSRVQPFAITSSTQFRVAAPPPLASPAYAAAYAEVKDKGGAGLETSMTPTSRTEEQTEIGIYWGYDGTPGVGTPPRLYNQIAVQISEERNTNVFALARLLALVNVAMADAAIASWDAKYFHAFWRPVTAIQKGEEDGNPATEPDDDFEPLGAPLTNLSGKYYSPPFPAYTSGHATFGGALFQVLRRFYGTDLISFRFQSDEYNGFNKGSDGKVRPRRTRKFDTLTQAAEENGQSRIYLGIHFSFDKTRGITQGKRVANFVFRNAFVRVGMTAMDPGDPAPDGTVDLGEEE